MTGVLLDENMPHAISDAIHQRDASVSVYWVGDGVAPAIGAPDPDLLCWIEEHDCLLVTNNRNSMPVHPSAHLAAGHHVPGVIQVPEKFGIGSLADDVLVALGASLPGELADHITYVRR